jgi:hypothetical protein
VQRRHGTRGRRLAPELIDQPVAGDRYAPTEHEQCQQRALAAAGQRHTYAVPLEHERAKDPEATCVTDHP